MMIRLLLLTASLSCHLLASAQKDFEGMIRYRSITVFRDDDEVNKPDTADIIVLFAPSKLSITFNRKEESNTNILLLDSAKSYTLDKEDKTYRVKRLRKMVTDPAPIKETILGYPVSPVLATSPILLAAPGDVRAWFADSLFFHIPPGMERNDELLMVANNRILLKATINGIDGSREMEEDSVYDGVQFSTRILITAVEIRPGGIHPSDFEIPPGYTKQVRPAIREFTIPPDTIAITDTGMAPPPKPAKKPPAKTPAPKPVTTPKTTSPARKD